MRNPYILIHRRAIIGQDSFTYGNWRQYIVKRDAGAVQPCKLSMVPFWLALIGAALVAVVTMTTFMVPLALLDGTRVNIFTGLGFFLLGLGGSLQYGPQRLMVAVGPKSLDGRRRFWGEAQ